jgi:hypothetical protein
MKGRYWVPYKQKGVIILLKIHWGDGIIPLQPGRIILQAKVIILLLHWG